MMPALAHDALTLAELLDGFAAVGPDDDCEIRGLCLDSRRVEPGDCFVALNGASCHGAQFTHDAIVAGASAVMIEDVDVAVNAATPVVPVNGLSRKLGLIAGRFYGEPSSSLDIIAVTGTNGKTTVAQLCAQALKRLQGDAGYAGTLGLGRIGALQRTRNTTPDPITLQGFFAELRDRGCRAAAIEVSSHAIVQSRVVGTALDVVIFTNLGHDHLEYHGSRQAYARVKKSLFQTAGIGHVVVNLDDAVGREIIGEVQPGPACWTYSTQCDATAGGRSRHLYLRRSTSDRAGSRLVVALPQGEVAITTPLIGDFNAQNLMAALAALLALGIEADSAAAALSDLSGSPGRMQIIESGAQDGPLVVVDYAHTPESLSQVLGALRSITQRRLICVFGCGGERDKSKRAPMGRAAEQGADKVIVTADNPRGERNRDIAAEILRGMRLPGGVEVIHDRARAIETAIDEAGVGDIVLIAGKGHESFQDIDGVRRPFSDSESAGQALRRPAS